jgi:hypothetical protein
MRLTTVLILGMLAPVFQAQGEDGTKIWTDKNDIWVQTAAGPRQITHDGIPKRLAELSPTGNRLVYVVDDWSSNAQHKQPPKQDVVEMGSNGRVLRHIVPEGYVPEPFERLEWIDSQRVGAMTCGHANCFYWILDANSGNTLKVMKGGFDFIWSHNRRWVARRFVGFLNAPAGTPTDELDYLMLNETWIYPPRAEVVEDVQSGATHQANSDGHTLGPFTWSPHDLWLAFTDRMTPTGDAYVVLASPKGVILRETVPVDVEFDAKVEWADDTHLQLATGGRIFKFVVDRMELRELTTSENFAGSPK